MNTNPGTPAQDTATAALRAQFNLLLRNFFDILQAKDAEIERLKAGGCARDQSSTQFCAEAATLAAKLEEQRGRADKYWTILCKTANALGQRAPEAAPYVDKWAEDQTRELGRKERHIISLVSEKSELQAENDQLKIQLREKGPSGLKLELKRALETMRAIRISNLDEIDGRPKNTHIDDLVNNYESKVGARGTPSF